MFENREVSSRIGKWATQLAEHAIDFISKSTIKSQVLADFIADWTPVAPSQEQPKIEAIWQLECDGAYLRDGAGASVVLTAPSGTQLKYAVRLDFKGAPTMSQNTKAFSWVFAKQERWRTKINDQV